MSQLRLWIGMVGLAALSLGCTVGPNFQRPKVSVPTAWAEGRGDGVTSAPLTIVNWWTIFNDPVLTSLIEEAGRSNLDVKVAEARIREARAQIQIAQSAFWPTVNSSAAYTRIRASQSLTNKSSGGGAGASAAPKPSAYSNLYQLGFDSSWEIDVFGGTRRTVEAAQDDLEATIEGQRAVQVSLFGEVASNYIQLRGLQLQLKLTNQNLKLQQQTQNLTQARFEAGLVSELDVARAKAQTATTSSQVPALEASIRQTIHRLGVLLGKDPGTLLTRLAKLLPIPVPPAKITAGLPSDLLRRRPDVRLAERQAAAATARIGVAVADLYPKFSISGALGTQSIHSGDLFKHASSFWDLGPSVTWPVFAGGRILANVKVQNARQEQAVLGYEQSILTALQDTEDAFVGYVNEQTRRQDLLAAVKANQQATDLAQELYYKGFTNFLDVLDAQRNLYATQFALAQSDANVSGNLVALYKALGGGWELAPAVSPVDEAVKSSKQEKKLPWQRK